MGYISSVYSGGQSCAVLADQNVMGFISAIHELASRERQFYCWLCRVKKLVLTPIRGKGNWKQDINVSNNKRLNINIRSVCCHVLLSTESASPFLGDPCAHLFSSLCESFSHLSVLIGRHSTSLTYFLQNAQGRDVTSLPLLTHMEHFLDIYKEYGLTCTEVIAFIHTDLLFLLIYFVKRLAWYFCPAHLTYHVS